MNSDISHDAFLGGKLKIHQPKQGYRAGLDAVFLAAAVTAKPGHKILELGAGVGTVSLCLAHRLHDCNILAIERDPYYAALAQQNIENNQLSSRIHLDIQDIRKCSLAHAAYDHVMTNPPFFSQYHVNNYSRSLKGAAHVHDTTTLECWLMKGIQALKPKGSFTIIHRADHLGLILEIYQTWLGGIIIFPLWSGIGKSAHRVIVQGFKNSKSPLVMLPGMVINKPDGRQTPETENILRHGHGLCLTST